MTARTPNPAEPVLTEDGPACPQCGSTRFQAAWEVTSVERTGDVEVLDDGSVTFAPSYDTSEVIWDAVSDERIECASCCVELNIAEVS